MTQVSRPPGPALAKSLCIITQPGHDPALVKPICHTLHPISLWALLTGATWTAGALGGLHPKSPIVGSPLPATAPGEGSRVPPRLLRPSPSLLAVLSPGNVPKPEGTGVSASRAPFLPSTSAKPSGWEGFSIGPSLGPRTGHPQKGHSPWGGGGRGGQGSCHHICDCVERPHEDPGPEDP